MGRILNFGSLNIDHVYAVERFVSPGETLSSNNYAVFPGGKGLNQSIALKRAGAAVSHAGRIGPDGLWLKLLLEENGVNADSLETGGAHTGHAIIQVDRNGQNCILLYGGANREITREQAAETIAKFGPGDLLVLQNEINLLPEIIQAAAERGLRIALNPSPMDDAILSLPLEKITWFLLNEVEAEAFTGEKDPDASAAKLLKLCPRGRFVLTLGKAGCVYFDADTTLRHGIYDVPVVDTTAAGDTFTGFFLAAVTRGEKISEALRLASLASSIAVSRKGAAGSVPTLAEVLSSGLKPVC